MEYFLPLSVNKNVIIIRDSGPSNVNSRAIRALRKEKNSCNLADTRLHTFLKVSPKGIQDVKNRGYWP